MSLEPNRAGFAAVEMLCLDCCGSYDAVIVRPADDADVLWLLIPNRTGRTSGAGFNLASLKSVRVLPTCPFVPRVKREQ